MTAITIEELFNIEPKEVHFEALPPETQKVIIKRYNLVDVLKEYGYKD